MALLALVYHIWELSNEVPKGASKIVKLIVLHLDILNLICLIFDTPGVIEFYSYSASDLPSNMTCTEVYLWLRSLRLCMAACFFLSISSFEHFCVPVVGELWFRCHDFITFPELFLILLEFNWTLSALLYRLKGSFDLEVCAIGSVAEK